MIHKTTVRDLLLYVGVCYLLSCGFDVVLEVVHGY